LDEKWFYLQSRKESLTLVYQAHEHVSSEQKKLCSAGDWY
jgi:hypothetical protein